MYCNTESAPSGLGWVAEKGREIIEDKSGNMFMADSQQLYDFKGGEKVYKNTDTERMINQAIYADIAQNGNEGIESRLDSLVNKMDNLKQLHVDITEHGLRQFTKKGNSTTTYLNNMCRK